jgi:hypothetical protein
MAAFGLPSEHPTFLSGPAAARPAAVHLTEGALFGPYRIVRTLGHGGMGDVYEAEHTEHGRRVALKVLGQQLSSEADRQRFLREGELAASLAHRNAVYVYGSEEIAGAPVITMELLPGGTLRDLVQARGPLPPWEAVDLTLQIVAGLDAAFSAGILHRDIKPANCFIDRDGQVKVGDFGLSVAAAGRENAASGIFQGTPQFAAPEQIRGEALDVRADIYAVGATLFYLLTGQPPFDDRDLTTLITRVREEPAREPRALRGTVPGPLSAVAHRCLEKDREHRPATYAELATLLRPFSSTAPSPAPLGRRFLAGAVDQGLIGMAFALLAGLAVSTRGLGDIRWWVTVAQVVGGGVYFALLEGLGDASLGKRLLGLTVVGPDGRPPGVARATGRALIFRAPSTATLVPIMVFGLDRFTRLSLLHPWIPIVQQIGVLLLQAVLFSTARKANGYAAWQDRWTGTRVVRRAAADVASAARPGRDVTVAPSAIRFRGPFEVVGSLGPVGDAELLTGFDPRLKRRVWIVERAIGAAPTAGAVRDLNRPTRLRWLAGRRTEREAWDAFEAVEGEPLVNLASARPWAQVRGWLVDLAGEIEAGVVDGSLGALTLDRVWISTTGRARLLDFRAPGALDGAPTSAAAPMLADAERWLAAVAHRGMGGPGARRPVELPLAAHQVLDALARGDVPTAEEVRRRLLTVQGSADRVTRSRRALSVALSAASPVVFLFLSVVTTLILRNAPPQSIAFAVALQRLSEIQADRSPAAADERAAIETVLAGRYRSIVSNDLVWNTTVDGHTIATDRGLAEDVVTRHPNVTSDELARADAELPKLEHDMQDAQAGADRRAKVAWFYLPVLLFTIGLSAAAIGGVVFAFVFNGGLFLRVLGLRLVDGRGSPTSRVRSCLRAVVAWAPVGVFAYGEWASGASIRGGFVVTHPVVLAVAIAALIAFVVGALVAATRRSIQDVLLRTWVVPA